MSYCNGRISIVYMFDKCINMKGAKLMKRSRQRFLFVGKNSSFHGLNRLFNPYANLLSRIFWLVIITLSIGGVYLMMGPLVQLGMENSFMADTRYIEWTTIFPGVTVCEHLNTNFAYKRFNASYPSLLTPLKFSHRWAMVDMLYASKKCSHEQCQPCGKDVPCDVQWRNVIERIRRRCDEMLSDCHYNGVSVPCCQYFRRVDSEYGPCFSFNSLQHKEHQTLFTVNRTTGPATLTFRLLYEAEISIHSSEEISTNSLDPKMKMYISPGSEDNYAYWLFRVVEMENDPMLQSDRLDRRGCRFLNEVPDRQLHTYPVYSYGACELAYRTEDTMSKCDCIHPARDLTYKQFYCNYTGITCWNGFEVPDAKKETSVVQNSDDGDDEDQCLPSCIGSELSTIHFTKKWLPEYADKEGAFVSIQMASLPTLRYSRNLRRTQLDLVVSVGGIAGLFFSASILSFIEIFYLILRRQKFDNVK